MKPTSMFLLLAVLFATGAQAQSAGSATGEGVLTRYSLNPDKSNPEPLTEQVAFSPRYSYAYAEKIGAQTYSVIVLTEQPPPFAELHPAAGKRDGARRSWCEKQKASFVALMLDPESAVHQYFLCPADGNVSSQMLSTNNGLDSIVVKFSQRDAKRLKGTLVTGEGNCSADDQGKYCEKTGDFTFDAPILP